MDKSIKPIYLDREISWLSFNERVLQEANDKRNPLISRIKFLGIFSNNLDEFFRVRVATLNRLAKINKIDLSESEVNPKESIKLVNRTVREQHDTFICIFNELMTDLKEHNIFLVNENELEEEHQKFVSEYFQQRVRPNLFPLMLKNITDPSILKDKSIYLAVELKKAKNPELVDHALIKVPSPPVDRFLVLPRIGEKQYIIMLDDVIRFCLDDVFSILKYDTYKAYTIKITRDAEMDLDNDVSKSFMEIMQDSLRQRHSGDPMRCVYDREMPAEMQDQIFKVLKITKKDTLVPSSRYHNNKDLMKFPNIGSNDLEEKAIQPLTHKDLSNKKRIFKAVQEKDVLLHFPYQSFNYVIDLLREASIDPKIRSIKITLYRLAQDSNVINALVNAARNGKSVTVFLELQARFDEKANIQYAERLQRRGVKIIQSIPGFKVHSKLLLIRRRENDQQSYIAYIGTGNFNESTAKVYSDVSLLTANPLIIADVRKVFSLFESNYTLFKFKHLLVSPFATRQSFIDLLNTEIKNKKEGKNAYAKIKLNNLVDKKIINKLYEASQAGVRIKLNVRGICTLIPGVPGLSENIECISIVDKFLEHARIFAFCNEGDPKVFIGSADWMGRNFDNRIEVTTPIFDEELKTELLDIFDFYWRDNFKARIIQEDQKNKYLKNDQPLVRSQEEIYKYLKSKY